MKYRLVKRILDICLSSLLIPIALPISVLLIIIIKATSKGPVIFWSKRVGQNNRLFMMPKFRTMKLNTPQLATHILNEKDPNSFLTSIGGFLRKSSLDEIPQVLSVLLGDMSFIGPRPALFNQEDLIDLRTKMGVHTIRPGITGYAQVNGRDELPISQKVEFDYYYLQNFGPLIDFKILYLTFFAVLKSKGVSH